MKNRVSLHYELSGPPDAQPVLLLHAIGGSTEMWSPQIQALRREFRVVAVDLRGHGKSPVPPGPYSITELAGDVLRLLDDLEIEQADLGGLSLGGMVALSMAATAPQRVGRLVAACVVAVPAAPMAWIDRAQRVRAGGTSAIGDLVVERWGYRHRQPHIAQQIRSMLAATPTEGYAACCDAIAAMDLRPLLGGVSAPSLLIVGGEDPAAPLEAADDIAAAIIGAKVSVIEGAAHLVTLEAPDAVTDAVRAHLGGKSNGFN